MSKHFTGTLAAGTIFGLAGLSALAGLAGVARGQTIDPFFADDYTYTDLGSISGLPSQYGGLCTARGDDNLLLIGGAANTPSGTIYGVRLVRDADQHIIGFDGVATSFCEGAYNDGGIFYGPGGVLFYSRWPVNQLGQILPGSTTVDKIIDLTPFGVESSNAALNFVPAGFPGAGRMKISSWQGGQWGDLTIAPDGLGTYDVLGFEEKPECRLVGGPEGFAYVPPGSALFDVPSMIVSEYSAGSVSVYDIDDEGDPITSTRRVFMTELFGAEGAFIDRPTGDFVFSTFGGGSRVIVVRGFTVPPPICAECAADFNDDGGVDGGDVEAFFAVWQEGGACADVNADGGVEGADIEAFFAVWVNGAC